MHGWVPLCSGHMSVSDRSVSSLLPQQMFPCPAAEITLHNQLFGLITMRAIKPPSRKSPSSACAPQAFMLCMLTILERIQQDRSSPRQIALTKAKVHHLSLLPPPPPLPPQSASPRESSSKGSSKTKTPCVSSTTSRPNNQVASLFVPPPPPFPQ